MFGIIVWGSSFYEVVVFFVYDMLMSCKIVFSMESSSCVIGNIIDFGSLVNYNIIVCIFDCYGSFYFIFNLLMD